MSRKMLKGASNFTSIVVIQCISSLCESSFLHMPQGEVFFSLAAPVHLLSFLLPGQQSCLWIEAGYLNSAFMYL